MPGKTRKKRRSAPLLLRRLRKHFEAEPADLPVVEQHFDLHDRGEKGDIQVSCGKLECSHLPTPITRPKGFATPDLVDAAAQLNNLA